MAKTECQTPVDFTQSSAPAQLSSRISCVCRSLWSNANAMTVDEHDDDDALDDDDDEEKEFSAPVVAIGK